MRPAHLTLHTASMTAMLRPPLGLLNPESHFYQQPAADDDGDSDGGGPSDEQLAIAAAREAAGL